MKSVDSFTLFQQGRLEMKAAAAWHEEAKSAQRYMVELAKKRDDAYLDALHLGVPARIAAEVAVQVTKDIERVHEEGLTATEMANYHRAMGEALLSRCEKVRAKENRRFARGK